jgi:hypothetical protein
VTDYADIIRRIKVIRIICHWNGQSSHEKSPNNWHYVHDRPDFGDLGFKTDYAQGKLQLSATPRINETITITYTITPTKIIQDATMAISLPGTGFDILSVQCYSGLVMNEKDNGASCTGDLKARDQIAMSILAKIKTTGQGSIQGIVSYMLSVGDMHTIYSCGQEVICAEVNKYNGITGTWVNGTCK